MHFLPGARKRQVRVTMPIEGLYFLAVQGNVIYIMCVPHKTHPGAADCGLLKKENLFCVAFILFRVRGGDIIFIETKLYETSVGILCPVVCNSPF
jgi:hypothetical protein